MTDPTSAMPEPPSAPPRRRHRWKLIVAGLILLPIALFALYTATVLTWSYSDGDRAGQIFKFSHKGWLCKTWEGELNITPGAAAPTIWVFSVRDEQVARQINEALGKSVVLHYTEHAGVPTRCFGETNYFVDGVRVSQP